MVDVWWVVLGMNMLLFGELVACWMCYWRLVDVLLGNLWLVGCVVGVLWMCCWGKVDGQETYGTREEATCSWD